MAVALRAVSSGTLNNTSSGSINKPTGTAEGDILIAFHSIVTGSLTDMGTPTGGSTWQSLATRAVGTGSDLKTKVWWKVAGASEPATYGFTQVAGGRGVVAIAAVSGGSTSTPVVAQAGDSTVDTTTTTPSITPAGTADLELRWAAGNPDSVPNTWTVPATYTEQADLQASNATGCLATKILSSGAATGTQTFTSSTEMLYNHGFTVGVTTASVPANVDLTTVAVTSATPAPTATVSALPTPGAVPAAATVLTPTATGDGNVTSAAVPATATVFTPLVTTENAEIVTPDTVTALTAVPVPGVSAGSDVTAGAASAVATVLLPDVDAEFNASVTLTPVAVAVTVPGAVASVPVLPGDQITADGQVELNGTLWGAGTVFTVQQIDGWRSLPAVDNLNVTRPNRHGAWGGRKLAQQRLVTIQMRVNSRANPEEIDDVLAQLDAVTGIAEDETPLPLVIKGYGAAQLAYGQVIDRSIVMDGDWSIGLPPASVLVACADPRRYNIDATGVTVAVGDSEDIVNAGNTATHPVLRISGPCVNPVIVNETLDRTLGFTITLLTGEQLVINCDDGTVTVADDEMSTLTGSSVAPSDWVLATGTNEVSFSADSGGSAGLEVLYRDAWL